MKTTNIAIDGPAGAGKSSIAKEISSELGFIYVDTGALYRTVALFAQENCPDSDEELIDRLDEIDIDLSFIGGTQRISLGGEDVTDD
ncbi:MAG: (d)CMP kinase, partial [Oscillospiraceae bacterium]|nr:(d)CMP kinase [Oscillospiraceae bacterium]